MFRNLSVHNLLTVTEKKIFAEWEEGNNKAESILLHWDPEIRDMNMVTIELDHRAQDLINQYIRKHTEYCDLF